MNFIIRLIITGAVAFGLTSFLRYSYRQLLDRYNPCPGACNS
jgi:hypothetical protein